MRTQVEFFPSGRDGYRTDNIGLPGAAKGAESHSARSKGGQ